ncbi:hypothetical protein ERJ75_001591800 [Trypanosoma vivax]|nr:hypothetical protein ERJ75_001591800 [Trypanosoma vivax]
METVDDVQSSSTNHCNEEAVAPPSSDAGLVIKPPPVPKTRGPSLVNGVRLAGGPPRSVPKRCCVGYRSMSWNVDPPAADRPLREEGTNATVPSVNEGECTEKSDATCQETVSESGGCERDAAEVEVQSDQDELATKETPLEEDNEEIMPLEPPHPTPHPVYYTSRGKVASIVSSLRQRSHDTHGVENCSDEQHSEVGSRFESVGTSPVPQSPQEWASNLPSTTPRSETTSEHVVEKDGVSLRPQVRLMHEVESIEATPMPQALPKRVADVTRVVPREHTPPRQQVETIDFTPMPQAPPKRVTNLTRDTPRPRAVPRPYTSPIETAGSAGATPRPQAPPVRVSVVSRVTPAPQSSDLTHETPKPQAAPKPLVGPPDAAAPRASPNQAPAAGTTVPGHQPTKQKTSQPAVASPAMLASSVILCLPSLLQEVNDWLDRTESAFRIDLHRQYEISWETAIRKLQSELNRLHDQSTATNQQLCDVRRVGARADSEAKANTKEVGNLNVPALNAFSPIEEWYLEKCTILAQRAALLNEHWRLRRFLEQHSHLHGSRELSGVPKSVGEGEVSQRASGVVKSGEDFELDKIRVRVAALLEDLGKVKSACDVLESMRAENLGEFEKHFSGLARVLSATEARANRKRDALQATIEHAEHTRRALLSQNEGLLARQLEECLNGARAIVNGKTNEVENEPREEWESEASAVPPDPRRVTVPPAFLP